MVKAKIHFLGNRKYYNHYRPMIKIRNDGTCNSCELIFKNKDSVYAGEEIEIEIIFLLEKQVVDYLYKGKNFLLYEGQKVVGEGEIIAI